MTAIYRNKNILITGVGSIGEGILNSLPSSANIRLFDNSEIRLHDLRLKNTDKNIEYIIGDVRERDAVQHAMEDIDIVFNTAALKHVSFCEENPYAAVNTNIIGTQNVIDAAKHVEKLINISTDKAANPISVMGATKLIIERLVRHAGFTSVRLGNVFASNGSVVEIFKHQIKNGKPVTITDSKMTRFIISIEEAVDFILRSSFLSKGRDIFILKMPAFSITDLALAISEDAEMKTIGKYNAEKLHEILMTEEEMEHAYENEAMIVILPDKYHAKYYEELGFKKIKQLYPDSSQVEQLTIEDIKKLL